MQQIIARFTPNHKCQTCAAFLTCSPFILDSKLLTLHPETNLELIHLLLNGLLSLLLFDFFQFFASAEHLGFEDDWIEFVLGAHDHIEDGDENGEATEDHAHEQERLCLELLLGFGYDYYFEEHVDGQLREVLREERNETHQFTKHKRLSKEIEGIVDAEGVYHGGQEHVLSNKGGKACILEIGLIEHAALLDRFQEQVEKHDEREDQVQDREGQRRDRPVDILRPALHNQVHKADIQKCIRPCNNSHEQFDEVPLVELEETGLFKQLLDA